MNCRQCRLVIDKGEKYMIRQGERYKLVYHTDCFIKAPDPLTSTKELQDSAAMKISDN